MRRQPTSKCEAGRSRWKRAVVDGRLRRPVSKPVGRSVFAQDASLVITDAARRRELPRVRSLREP